MNRGLINDSKSMAWGGAFQRKKLTIGTIALALFVILGSPLVAQASSSAASAQSEIPEIRVAVTIAPPFVMEQNGSLTGFSIDLWNAIAKRLKVKTSYQIKPDVGRCGGGPAIQ